MTTYIVVIIMIIISLIIIIMITNMLIINMSNIIYIHASSLVSIFLGNCHNGSFIIISGPQRGDREFVEIFFNV